MLARLYNLLIEEDDDNAIFSINSNNFYIAFVGEQVETKEVAEYTFDAYGRHSFIRIVPWT